MKKLILIFISLIYISAFGQKSIEHNSTHIKIESQGFNYLNNEIDYSLKIPLAAIDSAVKLFPTIQGRFIFQDSIFVFSERLQIVNMHEIMRYAQVEPIDVGLTGDEVMKNFSIAILWQTNVLGLVRNNWTLKD